MKLFPWKSRKYPIKYDEYGRSARQQAFELFGEGYRPAQICEENLIPVPIKTLFRYFEDWKKQKHRTSLSILKKYMKERPEFSEQYIKMLADYYEVPPEDIIVRMQKPWGITVIGVLLGGTALAIIILTLNGVMAYMTGFIVLTVIIFLLFGFNILRNALLK